MLKELASRKSFHTMGSEKNPPQIGFLLFRLFRDTMLCYLGQYHQSKSCCHGGRESKYIEYEYMNILHAVVLGYKAKSWSKFSVERETDSTLQNVLVFEQF